MNELVQDEAHKYVQSVIDYADVWTEEWAENVFIAGYRKAEEQPRDHAVNELESLRAENEELRATIQRLRKSQAQDHSRRTIAALEGASE